MYIYIYTYTYTASTSVERSSPSERRSFSICRYLSIYLHMVSAYTYN